MTSEYYVDEPISKSIDETDENTNNEYEETLKMYRQLQEMQENENKEKYQADVKNLQTKLNVFTEYIKTNESNLSSKMFESDLNSEIRNEIFDGISKYYSDENVVDDNILFSWKKLILNMMINSKKYKVDASEIILTQTDTNMRLEVNKGVFRVCISDNENEKVPPRHVCYVKNNGDNYYLTG